ncbi:subtilisin-like protease SBT3.9 isoform X1 [Ziziphus jujuba]|uniref:Subtilisin-like protease SBT3.9 isoform X1 n=2 Tax=Ziziphus jujuba TaxID=326968 RepID=A0A6P4A8P5_ZIZJJ|nr:subtilisin-like protease SBT3.9 isoform X1 [Ziziphus jujuba]
MASPLIFSMLYLGLVTLQLSLFHLSASSNVHIVYMGEKRHDEPELVSESHHHILSHVLGSKEAAEESIIYSYKHGFSGFAAVLTQTQAKHIADFPGVVNVIPNRIFSLCTTRSWDFLQVRPDIRNGILAQSRSGSGSIIGIMDTGIWPESESFKDDGMGEIPSRWRGICQDGEQFNRSHCNRKIIGARWYIKGYEAEFGKLNRSDGVEFLSPRDASGHGTHTSSTAAGALIENASFMGLAGGVARGGAPSAWLAIYKVCWSTGGCSSADLLAAFDDAISDGVDVVSLSLGSPPPLPSYAEDVVSIGSFHAVTKGISVVCSGGNSGPYPQSVINTAPWILTVAASTIDRAFPTVITLGNNQSLVGHAVYTGMDVNKYFPLVYGEDIASINADEDTARSCDSGSLNETLARGKVVLCFQSRSQRSATVAASTVLSVNGTGLIFAKVPTKDVSLSWSLPCVQIDFTIGTYLLTYMEATRNPVVKFGPTRTALGQQISPEVAFFSSRGPSSLSPTVLKPDIAAPGVNILASWSPASSPLYYDAPGTKQLQLKFKLESGTSMSCPHISAVVALLKTIHPDWSPAAINSALITTASLEDAYDQSIVAEGAPHKQADPFDYGGGHVNPNKAISPGLVYDSGVSDYVQFLCSMGYNDTATSLVAGTPTKCLKSTNFLVNLNLPSITIPDLKQRLTVTRTVRNVGPENSVYIARIQTPAGVSVRVKPKILRFNLTVKVLNFNVVFRSHLRIQGRYSFGNLFWEDGFHVVRIPLIVRTIIEDFYAET